MELENLSMFYGSFKAIEDISLVIPVRRITALIGPSGCGKSTLIRCLNRMNDLIEGVRIEGEVTLDGDNIYRPGYDAIELRRRVGMVFQRPNPFPKSIYENVAYGPRLIGVRKKSELDGIVEELSLIHISEPTRLGMISYAVFCLKKKKKDNPGDLTEIA